MAGNLNTNGYQGFRTQTDVSASRDLIGTVYHNTSGLPKLVVVSIDLAISSTVVAFCDSTITPTQQVGRLSSNATGSGSDGELTFVVVPGYYYKLQRSGGNPSVNTWIEWI